MLSVIDNCQQYVTADKLIPLDVFTIDNVGDLWMCVAITAAGIEAIDLTGGGTLTFGNETHVLKRSYTLEVTAA